MTEREIGRLTALVVDSARRLFIVDKSRRKTNRFPTYVDQAMKDLGLDPTGSHQEVRTRALRVFQRHSVSVRKKTQKAPSPRRPTPKSEKRFLFDQIVGNQFMLMLQY